MAVRRPTAAVGWAGDPGDKQPFVLPGCLSPGSPAHRPREARHRQAFVLLPFSRLLFTQIVEGAPAQCPQQPQH
jgi:hypothetical protein